MMTRKELEKFSKDQLIDLVLNMQEIIEKLERRISLLEKNSNNSSKPPSSDMNKAKRNQSLRQKTGRKQGGQKGHKGVTKEQVKNPDKVVLCFPDECKECGKTLTETLDSVISRRQEMDIPPIKPLITEYRQIEIKCECGCLNKGEYPSNIKAPFQMGRNIQSFLVYLNVSQLIPYGRLEQLCKDIFNFSLCKRTIENILEKAYEKGKPLHKDIMDIIKGSPWVGADETGERVEGERWWKWVWQNIKATYYAIDKSRGYKVVKEHFGEDYSGKLIHDCWSAHNNTIAGEGHQQCHPHIQRELQFLIEKDNSKWAYDLNKFLGASQKARDKIWENDFDEKLRWKIIEQYKGTLITFIEMDEKKKDVLRVQKRIRKHKNSILLFMRDKYTPFHNNNSEQAVRMSKVKQKISGCFRSQHGAERYSVLLSVIETAKKQNMNILHSIKLLLNGDLQFVR
jgi:transposase